MNLSAIISNESETVSTLIQSSYPTCGVLPANFPNLVNSLLWLSSTVQLWKKITFIYFKTSWRKLILNLQPKYAVFSALHQVKVWRKCFTNIPSQSCQRSPEKRYGSYNKQEVQLICRECPKMKRKNFNINCPRVTRYGLFFQDLFSVSESSKPYWYYYHRKASKHEQTHWQSLDKAHTRHVI